jgi:glucose/arabinose dehydrogenase
MQELYAYWRTLRILVVLGLAVSLVGAATAPSGAAPLPIAAPPGFTFEPVVDGFDMPTSFALAPDGRIFIAEKTGRVRVFADGQLQGEDFIDLRNEVNATNERGLLGVAVHPRWPAVPYVYLAYVYEPPEAKGYPETGARVSRVLRLSADPANLNRHLPGSGVIILGKNSVFANIGNPAEGDKKPYSCVDPNGEPIQDCLPDEGTSHSVNYLLFGKDGALYVSAGDGINFNAQVNVRAQNTNSPVGKILRIDPITGQGLPSNPFYDGNPESNRAKVYAVGLRNPFRFTLQPGTGRLFIGDVGNFDYEEINSGGAGANFGWPCYEGPAIKVDDGVCQPVVSGQQAVNGALYAYPHEDGRGAVIGGDFYVGRSYPAAYRGAYFFGEFNVGMMYYMTFYANGTVEVMDFASGVPGPVQITTGPGGDLYVLCITGALFRLRYSASAAGGAATTGTAAAAAAPATRTGRILAEWWEGIPGGTVADLTKSPKFQGRPTGTDTWGALEAPLSFSNDYGRRLRGYLHPPTTGEYRFWIAADDTGELWLSTDEKPETKRLIASAPAWTASQQFDKYPEQQSVGIALEAGKKYYIEVLHKDLDQKDNLAVAWQIPGGERAIVAGKYLSTPPTK